MKLLIVKSFAMKTLTRESLLKFFADTTPEQKAEGRTLYRSFCDGDRYQFDFRFCHFSGGWIQFDTDQDASYFGVWVHPTELLTLTFCEGDLVAVICDTPTAYNAEIAEMLSFYTPAPSFTVIDTENKTATDVYQSTNEYFTKLGDGVTRKRFEGRTVAP